MTIDTERMIATLEANFDKYNKALSKLEGDSDSSFSRVERRGKQMESRLSDIGENIKGFTERANTVLATIGVGIGLESITAASESIKKALEDVANIGNVAKQVGISTDALQELRFAAQKADVPVTSLDQALVIFGTHISQIASGGGKGVADLTRILQANGVAVKDQDGNFRSTTDILSDYANLIKNAASQQDRLRLAQVAFGDTGASLVNVLSQGSDGLRETAEEASNLGRVLSGETIAAAQELNDNWDQLINGMKTKFEQLVVDVVSGAQKMASGVMSAFNATRIAFGRNEISGVTDVSALEDAAKQLQRNIDNINSRLSRGMGVPVIDVKDLDTYSQRLSQINQQIANVRNANNIAGKTSQEASSKTAAHPTVIPPAPSTAQAPQLNAYQRLTQTIADRTKTLQAEAEAQEAVNPFINDYGEAVAEAKAKQDLLNAAQKAGIAITPEMLANINAEAKAFGVATAAGNQLRDSQEKLKKEMEDTRQLSKDVLGGFIEDLEDGKSAAEALGDAIKKVGDALLQAGLNSLFGQSGDNNWFSSLFGSMFGGAFKFPAAPAGNVVAGSAASLGLATGGPVSGPGSSTSDSIPARLSDGEYVVNARATSKHRALLDALNSNSVRHFADGGFAGMLTGVPSIRPVAAQSPAKIPIELHLTSGIDKDGNIVPTITAVSSRVADLRIQDHSKKKLPGLVKKYSNNPRMATG